MKNLIDFYKNVKGFGKELHWFPKKKKMKGFDHKFNWLHMISGGIGKECDWFL